ncbi:MAG TPA: hypothetical protein VGB28_03640 [Actinomycetota bacterium]|jgi:hypothetical protein
MTVALDDAAELARHLRASVQETAPLGDAAFTTAAEQAATRIEELVAAGDAEALAPALKDVWKALGGFAVTRGILAGGIRAFTATTAPDPAEPAPLERTPEAVFFLQKLVRDIQRSV